MLAKSAKRKLYKNGALRESNYQLTFTWQLPHISLSAILQHEATDGSQFVQVLITTHRASEGSVRAAVKAIDALSTIEPPTVCLRVIDQPREFAAG